MGRKPAYPLCVMLALAMLCWVSAVPSFAASGVVVDDAHLFDSAGVDKVNAIIKQIKQQYGKDLTIVTFPAVPESQRDRMATEPKETFYENWLREEARKAGTNGIFILIVKDPGHLQIGVGRTTRPKAFTDSDRDELNALMLKDFNEKHFDQGLLEGAKFVLDRLGKNLGNGNPPEPTGATGGVSSHGSTSQPATESAVADRSLPTTRPTTMPSEEKAAAVPSAESNNK